MDKRTILAVVLSLAVLITYQVFFAKKPAPPQPAAEQSKQTALSPQETATRPALRSKDLKAEKSREKKQVAAKDIKIETAQYTAIFSTRGGALKSFQLKNYEKDCSNCVDDIYPRIKNFFAGGNEQPKPKTRELVSLVDIKDGMPYPLAITFPESGANIAPDAIYETNTSRLDLVNAKEKQRLVFSCISDDRIKVEKIFTFNPDNYNIGLEIRVSNLTDSPLNEIPKLGWQQYIDPNQTPDSYAHEGPVAYVAKSVKRDEIKKLGPEKSYGPNVSWGGYETKYFMASIIPDNPALSSMIINHDSADVIAVGIKGQKVLIPGGQSSSFNYTLFIGPKDYSLLKKQGIALEESIEFESIIPGLKWLSIALLLVIQFMHQYVSNYGVAIILLTVIIKIFFWPLGNISFKSMKEMQNLQPKINELKERYKNDQAKLGQETMALYRSHKVNPFSGCLPIVIQIPIFIGLYNTLLYAIELRHSPLFWWIQDLSAKDPYYITPIIMGATQFIQQKMTPTMGDPTQAKLMLLMPLVFTFFFLNFPSGLVIYWLINNVLSIGQQYYMNKKLGR